MADALISDCGQYRYWLTRMTEAQEYVHNRVIFVMLNPSTADAETDDPTIRRCISFAEHWGFGSLAVVNLYAYRATKPADLWKASDPVGPNNDLWLKNMLGEYETVVCAWGANAKTDRVEWFVNQTLPHTRFMCLGTTKAGAPKHPLYIKSAQPLIPWGQ